MTGIGKFDLSLEIFKISRSGRINFSSNRNLLSKGALVERGGIHRILRVPIVYRLVQAIFRHPETQREWDESLKTYAGARVLDIGSGTGEQSAFFQNGIEYIGIDISEAYVEQSKKDFGEFGHFYVASLDDLPNLNMGRFDLVILKGVFHHLEDKQVAEFAQNVSGVLAKNGSILSLDPTFIKGRVVGNAFAQLDRGKHVRKEAQLRAILEPKLKVENSTLIKQKFPSYQRLLLRLTSS